MGGWESDGLRDRAMSLIDKTFRKSFSFPGVLTGQPKWNHYRQADIFSFPSYFHSETFPVVLLEAMSFSLPIVTTRWRGIPDVVKEGDNALLVTPKDVYSCAQALERLITSSELRSRMAASGRRHFVENFTVGAYRQSMGRVFKFLNESKRAQ